MNTLKTLLSIFVATALTACSTDDLATGGSGEQGAARLTVTTRSGSAATLPEPLTVYSVNGNTATAFATTGTTATATLEAGQYDIVAIAGWQPFASGKAVTANNITPTGGRTDTPVMLGKQAVAITNQPQTVDLTADIKVAAVDITLNDIPADATDVSIALDKHYTTLNMLGTYSGQATVILPCTQQSPGTWATGTAYVFPSTAASVTMTINITTPAGTTASSFVYGNAIAAATPYHFTGSYESGIAPTFTLSCRVAAGQWGSDVNETFSFGSATQPLTPVTPPTPTPATGNTIAVSAYPTTIPCDIKGHALIAYDEATHTGLLYSLECFEDQSANNDAIQNIAAQYTEKGLAGWSVPTEEQTKQICDAIKIYNTITLKELMATLGDKQITQDTKPTNDYVFLAGNADYKYKLNTLNNSAINQTELKATNLHLRLVKEVTLVLQ